MEKKNIYVYTHHLASVKTRSHFIVTNNPGLHHLVDPTRDRVQKAGLPAIEKQLNG